MRRCEVAVVGAGLAGLACARRLLREGLDVQILESSDAVGGRVRTDRAGGFLLDRGFQVLSTGYPEVRSVLDLQRLDLRSFERALLLRHGGRTLRLADPFREPTRTPTLVGAPIGSYRDKLALGAYGLRTITLPPKRLKARRDVEAEVAWRSAGMSERPLERLLRPFFAGVVLDEDLRTSRRFVDLMMRMFTLGRSVLPSAGMQAIPDQLAEAISPDRLHLSTPVRRVAPDRVETDGGAIGARAVVVATDASAAAGFLPDAVARPSWKGVTTVYHAAPQPPTGATLVVDAEQSAVDNVAVLSAAAPSYSADGRALIATSTVHRPGRAEPGEAAIRGRLSEILDCETGGWEHLATYDIARALPAMPAPHPFRRPVRRRRGDGVVYVCGDHRDTSSIQGALVSGRRAASAVLSDLEITEAV